MDNRDKQTILSDEHKLLLPKIKDVPKSEQFDLAIQMLKFCRIQHQNSPENVAQTSNDNSRKTKANYLEELVEYFGTVRGVVCEAIYSDLFALIWQNLPMDEDSRGEEENMMRKVGKTHSQMKKMKGGKIERKKKARGKYRSRRSGNTGSFLFESLNTMYQGVKPKMCELSTVRVIVTPTMLVYELLAVVLDSADFRVTQARAHLDQPLAALLLRTLANCPRHQCRAPLERVLRRIYAKFVRLRPFLRKQIVGSLLEVLFEEEGGSKELATTARTFYGIGELLGVLEEVINGFKVPLKSDDRQLLLRILLPLHRMDKLEKFHKKLNARILQMLELDSSLGKATILILLKYWPKTNSSREIIFVEELEMVLVNVIDNQTFKELAQPLLNQLAKCIASQHSHISIKVMQFWKNERILALSKENSDQIVQFLFDPLENVAKNHWNGRNRTMAKEVQNTLMEMNWKEYSRIKAEKEAKEQK